MAQMNLQYVKGVRTRFFNTLDKEIQIGSSLLDRTLEDIPLQELKSLLQHACGCILKINTYIDKLCSQSEKLAQALGDSDESLTQTIIEDDSSLTDKAWSVLYNLKCLEDDIKENIEQRKTEIKKPITPEETAVQKLCEFQMKLQQDFFSHQKEKSELQVKLQQELIDKQKLPPSATAVKLPKLDITTFNGNKLQWVEFWDSFESAVHKNDKLSPIDKFNYLKGRLVGEAKSAIAGLSLSNENYNVAIGILKERFGDRQEIIDLHYKRLLNLFQAKNTTESLRIFLDKIERHLRSLEVLQENLDQHVFVSMVRSKLPSDVLLQLEMLKGTDVKWTIAKLRDLLRQYVVSKEKAEKVKGNEMSQPEKMSRFQAENRHTYTKGNSKDGLKFSAEALVANETKTSVSQPYKKCRYCGKSHWSDECNSYKTVEERKAKLKGSCFKCLKDSHLSTECKSSKRCVYCGKVNAHHRSLCFVKFSKKSGSESAHLTEEVENMDSVQIVSDEPGLLSCHETVLMQTALTEVKGKENTKSECVRLILDSGSHRTYVTKALVDRLGLEMENEQEINVVTFGSSKSKAIKTKTTSLSIKLKNGDYMSILANVVPTISGSIQRNPIPPEGLSKLTELTKNLKLADVIPTEKESNKLELLLGNDYYLDVINSDKIEVSPGLYLLSSKLGWIVSGRTQLYPLNQNLSGVNMLILSHGHYLSRNNSLSECDVNLPIEPNLEDFWSMESIGINDNPVSTDDEKAMIKFKESLKRENGRYQVTWPWKDDTSELMENRGLAFGRLKSLVNKIQKQPDLMQRYNDVIQDQLDKGIIERVERATRDGIRHYIPHHVIITPQKSTTKLRVVYDASAKVRKDNKSLNECLYRGPVLLRDLVGMILRFRIPKVGIVSDIEKAFLQIELQPSDRDVTRFLWFKNYQEPKIDESHIQELRFCRVPFGVISSPFLLSATVESHLDSSETQLAEQLKNDIYMDNLITGTDTVEKAISLYKGAKAIFSDAKMNLREWMTNSKEVNQNIEHEDLSEETSMKVLGYLWNTHEDTLSVQQSKLINAEMPINKRNVLRQLASVFDPLGLFAPITLRGKILLQTIWIKQLKWDDPLDQEDSNEWAEIKGDLMKMSEKEIKRCISISCQRENITYSLVCFSDASGKAYAATIYLLQKSLNETKSDLIFCKSRIAPVKKISIPRLELLAVLIGVRCLKYVETQLKLPLDTVILMTDSQCVLHWISSTKILPVFIENRVKEIRGHTKAKFQYVNTKDNPADKATRGVSMLRLCEENLWWHGPNWVLLPSVNWPKMVPDSAKLDEIEYETTNTKDSLKSENVLTSQSVDSESPFGIDERNFSSMQRLVRVTAWCHRFIKRIRGQSLETKYLSYDELYTAEIMWVKHYQKRQFSEALHSCVTKKPNNLVSQLDLFIDECGMLRCGGRLVHANFKEAARFPLLLPSSERFTHLLIEKIHQKLLHSGVSQTLSEIRQQFWIPCGRATVAKVLKRCIVCKKLEGGAYKLPSMAPLPKSRVSESTPFTRVGIDYFGPLYIKENKDSQKIWVSLFTCLVTCAVHLELVNDMSADSFLLCFRRFISARGTPIEIISDNAKQFKLSSDTINAIWGRLSRSEEVQNYVSNVGIKWSFIVELAPWMGGFYERLVGLVKRALRKTIGRKLLSYEQMLTLLKECEAVVNSRPLVYVGEDLNSSISITPAHFISVNPHTGIPELQNDRNDPEYKPYESSVDKLLKLWKKGQKMLDTFWQIWRNEYLLSLRERTQSKIKSHRVQSSAFPSVGDVVLIKDNLPRGQWKMGKITELRSSHDGKIRSAALQISSGRTLRRPLNLLFPIEV